ncbi:uncharacterized protein LOC140704593 isoform X2 [Pogona vitticeps]
MVLMLKPVLLLSTRNKKVFQKYSSSKQQTTTELEEMNTRICWVPVGRGYIKRTPGGKGTICVINKCIASTTQAGLNHT